MAVMLLTPIIPQIVDEYKFLSNFGYWVPMAVASMSALLFFNIGGTLGPAFWVKGDTRAQAA